MSRKPFGDSTFLFLLSLLLLPSIACENSDEKGTLSDQGSTANDSSNTQNEKLGACGELIACGRENQLPGLSSWIEAWGEEGSCWKIDGIMPSDCRIECHTTFVSIHDTLSKAADCVECSTDDDCAEFNHDSKCGAGVCRTPSKAAAKGICETYDRCAESGSDIPASCVDTFEQLYESASDTCKTKISMYAACIENLPCDEVEEKCSEAASAVGECLDPEQSTSRH